MLTCLLKSPGLPRKRAKAMKPSEAAAQAPGPAGAPGAQQQQQPPPQTSPTQPPHIANQPSSAYAPGPAAPHAKPPPAKSTLKALPTVRDHTTDQLNATSDEYVPREVDDNGEKKVLPNGQLLGNRQYRCRTFLVPKRGDKLFMLATECARVLGYRDSYLLFNKNRSLYKIIASQVEKDDLVQHEILPFSYRSRQIAIVTARSMFRQFGSRVIENGRRVRDDYWETKARKQGFTEADLAGEKRPGAAKAREAAEAAAAAQNNVLIGGPHSEIVYNSNAGPYPGPSQPHLVQAGLMGAPPSNSSSSTRMPGMTSLGSDFSSDTRPRDFGGIIKGGPRQEITGPAYQDQTRPAPLGEMATQASNASDFNRSVTEQREMRSGYLQNMWRRHHDAAATSTLNQPSAASSNEGNASTSRPSSSPHTTTSGVATQPVAASHSPSMMMTAPPYSQPMHAPNTLGQPPVRSNMSQATPGYNYQSSQQQGMWSHSPQNAHHAYGSYTTQSQAPPHASQSPVPHLRQPSSGQLQPSMPYPAMSGMQYGGGQNMYPTDQTPRQYLPQSAAAGPSVTQPWSGQHSSPQQWWPPPQQPQ